MEQHFTCQSVWKTCGQTTFTEVWDPQREGKLRHKAKLGLGDSESSKAVASAQCPQPSSRLPSIPTAQSPSLQAQGAPKMQRRVLQCSPQHGDKGHSP